MYYQNPGANILSTAATKVADELIGHLVDKLELFGEFFKNKKNNEKKQDFHEKVAQI